ncbi:MAG: hypothetical protein ABSE92_01915 [Terriglobales bacterium]
MLRKHLQQFSQTNKEGAGVHNSENAPPIEQDGSAPIVHRLEIPDTTIDRIKSKSNEENKREQHRDRISEWTLIAIIVYAVVTFFQWIELNTQNINQATANTNSGVTADQTIRKMQATIDQTNALINATFEQAKATNNIARETRASLEETKREFRLDQRPRIAILNVEMVKDGKSSEDAKPIVGQVLQVNVPYQNVGKTAAYNVVTHRHLLFGKQLGEFSKAEPADSEHRISIGDTLEPTHPEMMTAFSSEDTIEEESVFAKRPKVWDGTGPIVVFGRITYKDNYGTLYCTPFEFQRIASGNWGIIESDDKLCPVGIR